MVLADRVEKLEQRLIDVQTLLIQQMGKFNDRFDGVHSRMNQLDIRMNRFDEGFDRTTDDASKKQSLQEGSDEFTVSGK